MTAVRLAPKLVYFDVFCFFDLLLVSNDFGIITENIFMVVFASY